MKHIFTLIGLASFLIFGWITSSVTAQATQPGVLAAPTLAATQQMPSMPSAVPYMQNPPVNPTPPGQAMDKQMGKRMGMQGGGRMGTRMGMQRNKAGGNQGGASAPASGTNSPMNVMMMASGASLYDGIARWFGLTSQDLYNQMLSGKSLAQIAAERGITQQQLNDAVMSGFIVAPDQVLAQIFDHNLTRYQLTGKHIQVPCSQCHLNNLYKGTPTNCIVCHAKDDVHRGKLGTDCAACHTTDTWKK